MSLLAVLCVYTLSRYIIDYVWARLYMSHARNCHRKLGRTVTQIRVLCGLVISWVCMHHSAYLMFAYHPTSLPVLLVGIMVSMDSICGRGWNADSCALYSSAHEFLVVCEFSAVFHNQRCLTEFSSFRSAFATYRRAATMHGITRF